MSPAMRLLAAALILAVAGCMASQTVGSAGKAPPGVSPVVAQYCVSHGYGPVGSENFDWCTVNFSLRGQRQELNSRPIGDIPGS